MENSDIDLNYKGICKSLSEFYDSANNCENFQSFDE